MTARTTRPTRSAPRTAGFRCTECGWTSIKWVGRCGECQSWGTVSETSERAVHGPVTTAAAVSADAARPIAHVDASPAASSPSGVGELDRVLGGGLVAGSVALVAGEPGIGKSTLLLDVAARVARGGSRVLYLTAEESAAQVRLRAQRIGAIADTLFLADETDLGRVLGLIESVQPELLVVDSVSTVASAEVDGSAGGVTQVREVASALIRSAKSRTMTTLLVGHVTKDGAIAGPRTLEHLVDVVLAFEGERHTRLRLVRAVKNRYGPTDEIGCFDMGGEGIRELPDPSELFLSSRDRVVAGTAVTVTLEGRRPLVAEVQALLTPTKSPSPRRATVGLDGPRVAMLLAVLAKHGRLPSAEMDCYVSTVGGMRVGEPAADLAVAMAMASSLTGRPLPERLIAVGEVGLAGEVRRTAGVDRRLREAARLGFTAAIVPPGSMEGAPPAGMRCREVSDIGDALGVLVSQR